MTAKSPRLSSNSKQPPEGQILKVQNHNSGLSTVQLDNGVPHTITIVSRTEVLHELLATDLADIRAHLMTRQPGHFRKKS
jgi:hypothetical protein